MKISKKVIQVIAIVLCVALAVTMCLYIGWLV
jgi:hypothetical protein